MSSSKQMVRYVVAGVTIAGVLGAVVWLNRPVALPQAGPLPGPAGGAGSQPAPVTPVTPVGQAGGPAVNPAALKGHGDLVFVWKNLLYTLEGDTGAVRQLSDSGQALHPLWSHDGQWVAYIRMTDVANQAGPLWVVKRDGTGGHQVQGVAATLRPGDFVWSPTDSVLAVKGNGVWVAPADGAPRQLDAAPGLQALAWSPDGKQLAYNLTLPATVPVNRSDALLTVDLAGGKPVQHFTADQSGVVVAGWRPDGKAVLFWQQALHSGSLAADSMSLYSVELGSTTPKDLTAGLAHPEWLSLSPAGKLAAVGGFGRTVWTGKHLEVCDLQAVSCKSLPNPQGTVALDPALSPDGTRVAFVLAQALGQDVAGMKPDQLTEWVKSRKLWVEQADGSGARELTAAGSGVYQPAWSRDGSRILYVQDNALWLVAPDGTQASKLVSQVVEQKDLFGFYGFVSYADSFDWLRR